MAVIVKTIGSGAGRDFSTLAGWAASIPANLVTDGNSYEGHCYNDSEFVGTGGGSILTLTGHTTDASHTITLTTGPGQSFRDNANVQTNALRYNAANGVAITSDAGGDAGTINIGDSNVFLANLQVKNTGYHGNGIACGESDPQIEDCIVAGDARVALYNTDHNQTVRNCLLYVLEPSAQIIQGGHGIANLYFCTIVAPSDVDAPPTKAFNTGYGTASVAENCAIFGCAALDSPASITYTTCMTDLSSGLPSGVTGSKTYADQFQNITTTSADWREKPGAALRGAGTADATNGAIDIATTARPQGGNWDIGCWQSIVAGDTTLTIDVQATVEFSLALSGDANSPVEALAADRRDVQNPLEMGLVTVNDGACPLGFEGGVASGLAGNVEWLSLGFADRNIVSEWLSQPSIDGSFVGEWLKSSLLDTPAPGEFATSLIGVPPLTIEFQGQTQLTADGVLPIEWSALPAIMRVSLERLLSSPTKRRILGTSGRLRLLKRQ